MRSRILAAVAVLFTIIINASCSKGNFKTTPTLKVNKLNATEILAPALAGSGARDLRITLEVTDKEGDGGGGVITYVRIRTNIRPIPNPGANDKADTVRYTVPAFPKTPKSELEITVPYSFMDEDPGRNDTMFFKISLKDAGGHLSDTVSTVSVVARQI
jgi:hypothetical protein